MKAFYYQIGTKNEIIYGELPKPQPKAKEVLVEIHAASVNPSDWKMINDYFHPFAFINKPIHSLIPGQDISGVVVEVGKQVTQFKAGDEVMAMNASFGGGYAEYIAVKEHALVHKPSNMTFEEAAAVPQAALTGWQALIRFGNLQPGEKVLVIGASGGVGSYSVQIAKALGATVTGVCSTRNIELVKNLGADQVIDYTKAKFTEAATEFDIVYDTIGDETQGSCRSVLNANGRFLSTRPRLRIGVDWLLSNTRNAVTPHTQASTKLFLLTWPRGSDLKQIAKLIEQGQLRSMIDRTFPLEKATEAQEYSRQGRTQGKIILTMK